jgi:colanic acid/amylovoran biosynthesis glycosyltransferase
MTTRPARPGPEIAPAPASPPGARRLRVAFVVAKFPLVSETFLLNSARGVLDAGHALDVLSLHGPPREEWSTHPLIARYRLEERHHRIDAPADYGVRLRRAPRALVDAVATYGAAAVRTLPPFARGRGAWSLARLHQAARLPRADYDIVHCQFAHLATVVVEHLALGTLRGKLVVHLRGYDMTGARRDLGDEAYRRVFERADAVIATSHRLRALALAAGCPVAKIEVVTSGIDFDDFPFRPPVATNPPLRLVTVGRLVEKKGVAHTLAAVARLRADGYDVALAVVGDGPLRAALETTATRLGVDRHVVFHGALAAPEVAAVMAASDIFVAAPVQAANGDEDGVPNVLKEAMACGLPIVAFAHPGVAELIDDEVHGLLAAPGDAGALAARVAALIDRPQRWETLARAAYARARRTCSNDVVNARLLAQYHRLLAG